MSVTRARESYANAVNDSSPGAEKRATAIAVISLVEELESVRQRCAQMERKMINIASVVDELRTAANNDTGGKSSKNKSGWFNFG
mmetsp:Transcript_36786/g.67906  ORF Transcript_36786/g.67906 Transcript_36786/m.67906 type:complete len:85 (+) Transcript_36786:410-664(+)